jgi:hypothetical protein
MCAFVWYANSLNSKKSIVGILTFSAELASYLCRRRWVLGSITCRILSEIFWNSHCIFVQQLCDFPVLTSKPNLASAFAWNIWDLQHGSHPKYTGRPQSQDFNLGLMVERISMSQSSGRVFVYCLAPIFGIISWLLVTLTMLSVGLVFFLCWSWGNLQMFKFFTLEHPVTLPAKNRSVKWVWHVSKKYYTIIG